VLEVFRKYVYPDVDNLNCLKIVMASSEKPFISQKIPIDYFYFHMG
jgi:hypothetical protein